MYKFKIFYNLVKLITNQKWYGENSSRENSIITGLIIGIVVVEQFLLYIYIIVTSIFCFLFFSFNFFLFFIFDLKKKLFDIGSNSFNSNLDSLNNELNLGLVKDSSNEFNFAITTIKRGALNKRKISIKKYYWSKKNKDYQNVSGSKIDGKQHNNATGLLIDGKTAKIYRFNTTTKFKNAVFVKFKGKNSNKMIHVHESLEERVITTEEEIDEEIIHCINSMDHKLKVNSINYEEEARDYIPSKEFVQPVNIVLKNRNQNHNFIKDFGFDKSESTIIKELIHHKNNNLID